MNNHDDTSWLTLAFFFLTLAFGILYFIERADNAYLEERYHKCSGKYY